MHQLLIVHLPVMSTTTTVPNKTYNSLSLCYNDNNNVENVHSVFIRAKQTICTMSPFELPTSSIASPKNSFYHPTGDMKALQEECADSTFNDNFQNAYTTE